MFASKLCFYGEMSKVFMNTVLTNMGSSLSCSTLIQACGNTMPDLPDQVLDSTGQVLFKICLSMGK